MPSSRGIIKEMLDKEKENWLKYPGVEWSLSVCCLTQPSTPADDLECELWDAIWRHNEWMMANTWDWADDNSQAGLDNPPILNVQKHLHSRGLQLHHLATFSVTKTGLERNLKLF